MTILALGGLCGCNSSSTGAGADTAQADAAVEDAPANEDMLGPLDVDVSEVTSDVIIEDSEDDDLITPDTVDADVETDEEEDIDGGDEDVVRPDTADADVEADAENDIDVERMWPPEWQDCACNDEQDVCTPAGALPRSTCVRDIGRPCEEEELHDCPDGYSCLTRGDLPSLCIERGVVGLLQFCPTEHVPDVGCPDAQVCDGQGDVCRHPRIDCFTTMDCPRDEFCARRERSSNRREIETWFTPDELEQYDATLDRMLADLEYPESEWSDARCLPIADFPTYAAWATPPVENPLDGAQGPLCRTSEDCPTDQFCFGWSGDRADDRRMWGECLNGVSACPRETFEVRSQLPPDSDAYDCLYPTLSCEFHEECPRDMACVERSTEALDPDLCGIRRFSDGSLGVHYAYQNQRISPSLEGYPMGRRYLPQWMQADE